MNKPEASTLLEKRLWPRCFFVNFSKFIEYLPTGTSETVTYNNLGNWSGGEKFSARNEKLHIISIFSIRLTELKFSAQAENIHIVSPLHIWLGSQYACTEELANFYEYQNHILTLTTFLETPLHLKRLQEPFEAEAGELQCGSPAVVHS